MWNEAEISTMSLILHSSGPCYHLPDSFHSWMIYVRQALAADPAPALLSPIFFTVSHKWHECIYGLSEAFLLNQVSSNHQLVAGTSSASFGASQRS